MSLSSSVAHQASKAQMGLEPLNMELRELEHFYMTDSISRASLTMAKCATAVLADKAKNKYWTAASFIVPSYIVVPTVHSCSIYVYTVLCVVLCSVPAKLEWYILKPNY